LEKGDSILAVIWPAIFLLSLDRSRSLALADGEKSQCCGRCANACGRRRKARAAPFRRRACAQRKVIFRASFRKIAGWRQAQTAPSTGWPSSTPTIRTNPVWRHAELLLAREGNAARERNGAQRVRVDEGSHLTPMSGHQREGAHWAPLVTGSFRGRRWAGRLLFCLRPPSWGQKAQNWLRVACFADNLLITRS